mgnify:CR=1 FL=1
MTTIILCVILIGFLIIATESFHHINKSAVAMFIGVLCWVLYIGYGTDYVLKLHGSEFSSFLESNVDLKVHAAKSYIAQNIFSHYIIEAVQIIFYLLSTMSIIEVLSNNGCFDAHCPQLCHGIYHMRVECDFSLVGNAVVSKRCQ